MRKFLKWAAVVLAVLFVVAQFIPTGLGNSPVDQSRAIESRLSVPPQVESILARSCNDCHTNQTRMPWYAHVAPASWLLANHVRDGRKRMNFSDWASYDAEEQDLLLQNICRITRRGAMPVGSYLWIHHSAKLSQDDVTTLCNWSNAERDKLDAK